MSRPDIPAGIQSAVQNDHVNWFPLIKMEFDVGDGGTLYVAGTDFPVTYDGQTWIATRGLVSMEPIVETSEEVTGIKFTLAGVTDALIAEALLVKYQGRPCTILWACLNGATLVVDPQAWQGRLDVPEIKRGRTTKTISVTAEHRMADWARTRGLMFNDADQRRIDATDTFFVGCEQMTEKEIVLFSREVMLRAKG